MAAADKASSLVLPPIDTQCDYKLQFFYNIGPDDGRLVILNQWGDLTQILWQHQKGL